MTKFYITSKPLNKLSKDERKRLNYLTLRPASLMRDDVLHRETDLEQFQIFLTRINTKIVGWAVIFPEHMSTEWPWIKSSSLCIYTYVQYAHRRKGIGKQLLRRASLWSKRKKKKVKVFAWDKRSDYFFESCNKLPIKIIKV